MTMTTAEQETTMADLVRGLVVLLVDEPESVRVAGINNEGCVILSVTVAANDIGKVIGKEGRTARSIRTILAAVSAKNRTRFELNIDGLPVVAGGEL